MVQAGNVREVAIERQQAGSGRHSGGGDPHVVDRNRSAGAAEGGASRAGISPSLPEFIVDHTLIGEGPVERRGFVSRPGGVATQPLAPCAQPDGLFED